MGEKAERRVFDNSGRGVSELFALHPKGVIFVCPSCGADLVVVLDRNDVKREGKHPGVYCPTDSAHVWRMFHLRREGDSEEGATLAPKDGGTQGEGGAADG